MKRTFDITLIILGMPLWITLMVIVAISIRIKLGSPIFFNQLRPGFKGQLFTMYKFRTMANARDAHGRLLPENERLTNFGRFLRMTSLDEIPQLINVLKADMSLVGPRPLGIAGIFLLKPEELSRHDVLPGITGWAQIQGRNRLDWDSKIKFDLWYIAHRCLYLDIKIIFKTFWVVLSQQGVDPGTTHKEVAFIQDSFRPLPLSTAAKSYTIKQS